MNTASLEEIQKRLKKLENEQCCCKPVFEDTINDFPTIGKVDTLYVDRSNSWIYTWDGNGYITGFVE